MTLHKNSYCSHLKRKNKKEQSLYLIHNQFFKLVMIFDLNVRTKSDFSLISKLILKQYSN